MAEEKVLQASWEKDTEGVVEKDSVAVVGATTAGRGLASRTASSRPKDMAGTQKGVGAKKGRIAKEACLD